MGHQDIARFPTTLKWRAVLALIAGGADVSEIASRTSESAEASLLAYGDDLAVRRAFFLLARLPLAAKEANFEKALSRLGLGLEGSPNLMNISRALILAI